MDRGRPTTRPEGLTPGDASDRLYMAMRRARSSAAEDVGRLTQSQMLLLRPLLAVDALPVSEIAAAADVSLPTATRSLSLLGAKGLITRARTARDGRTVLIGLTADGRDRVRAAQSELDRRRARVLAAFSPDELLQLTVLMDRFTAAIAAEYSD